MSTQDAPSTAAEGQVASLEGEAAELTPEQAEAARKKAEEKKEEQDQAARREAALSRLMSRISEHSDFPSLRDSIRVIQEVTRSERAHLQQLSGKVLNDVALTGKLLRIINAAFYRSVGGGNITSIQRALALMGFETVGMLAASLLLFEKVPKGRDGEVMRQECSKALLSGLLAQQLCQSSKHFESVYLTALFMNLGNMLVSMHFPGDAHKIRKEVEQAAQEWLSKAQADAALHTGAVKAVPKAPPGAWMHQTRQKVAKKVLGLTLEDLGMEVARQWGWPEHLITTLQRLHPEDPSQEAKPEEYLRMLCSASCDLAVALQTVPKQGAKHEEWVEACGQCLTEFGKEMAVPLRLNPETLPEMGEQVLETWKQVAEFLGINPTEDASGRRTVVAGPPPPRPKFPVLPKGPERITQALTHVLKGMSELAESDAPIETVMDRMMGDLTEALSLQRVIVALKDLSTGHLAGYVGMGSRAAAVVAAFKVPVGEGKDLFSILCGSAKDTLIADTGAPLVASRLPSWYPSKVAAKTFVLLPLSDAGQLLGVLYADRQMAGSLVLNEREMTVLKSVRNQLVRALKYRDMQGLPTPPAKPGGAPKPS